MIGVLGLNIHLYGLLIGLGVWIGFEIALRKKDSQIKKEVLESALMWAVIGSIGGARLYHVIDYWSRYYSQNLIKVFFVWEGGLGIWGAIVGGILATYLFCLIKKQKFLLILDTLLIGAPVAQAIGRVGNFVNGELYGKNGEPLFAYEAMLNLVLFAILWNISKKKIRPGLLTRIYLIGYGVIRITLESLRPDNIIWRIGDLPVAMLFGICSILIGVWIATNPLHRRAGAMKKKRT